MSNPATPLYKDAKTAPPTAAGTPADASLDDLLKDIQALEQIVDGWDEQQSNTVAALCRAHDALHKAAIVRLIQAVK